MGFFDFLPWNRPECITFAYRRRNILDPSSSRPVVTLLVRGKDEPQQLQFLVDSGADVTSFPLSYAKDVFGITLDKQKKVEIIGIAREPISGFASSVDISKSAGTRIRFSRISLIMNLCHSWEDTMYGGISMCCLIIEGRKLCLNGYN